MSTEEYMNELNRAALAKAGEKIKPLPVYSVEIKCYVGRIRVEHGEKGLEISGECANWEALPRLLETARVATEGCPEKLKRKP